ncbi:MULTISPECIES: hypothetical protein [Streptomyces]|uniref:Uncharacterized protein n=2 Tax=Streptomyces TaxID=1883 RepID=A0A117IWV4_9ACTN|nr:MULTISPECIES: hypothetical protein [Streptomyces]KUH38783.1 hypothetical protein ATE80_10950 [Streptomyces kanasensis]UUS34416.1 hypothetical protein NRO40_28725 [Streptomyces changanensis]
MFVLGILLPPFLLLAVVLLGRYEDRILAPPDPSARPAPPAQPRHARRGHLRLVHSREPGAARSRGHGRHAA